MDHHGQATGGKIGGQLFDQPEMVEGHSGSIRDLGFHHKGGIQYHS